MNITLIGYGRMGKEIESRAIEKGHDIILRIDKDNTRDLDSHLFLQTDVAIEFSSPDAAFSNIKACIESGITVVSGTTGWTERLAEITKLVESRDVAFLYASNFSIGVNILFNLNRRLAAIMEAFPDYHVRLEEAHHIMKKDAPSGTAIRLADDIIKESGAYKSWHSDKASTDDAVGIFSIREGKVPGTHKIDWQSDNDTITLEHRSHSRKGFALGAVFAAEFIQNRKGVFTMSDLLGF